MTLPNLKEFMKKNLKAETLNESDSQRVYNLKNYPRVSKIYSDKGFVYIDDGT